MYFFIYMQFSSFEKKQSELATGALVNLPPREDYASKKGVQPSYKYYKTTNFLVYEKTWNVMYKLAAL